MPIRQRASAPTASSAIAAVPVGKTRQVMLIGFLGLMLAVMASLWFMNQPDRIETGPYSDQLPVISAISPGGHALIIRVAETKWGAMPRDERESRLRGAMATAAGEGFEAVFINSSKGQFLGSVRGGKTFLPE
jgi:hypothetical protein